MVQAQIELKYISLPADAVRPDSRLYRQVYDGTDFPELKMCGYNGKKWLLRQWFWLFYNSFWPRICVHEAKSSCHPFESMFHITAPYKQQKKWQLINITKMLLGEPRVVEKK